jgi:hypothetical protein
MVRVPNMGMRRDLAQRVSLARVDDVDRRARLQAAWTAVYENNHPVNGAAVKRLLDQDSLVPSVVSVFFCYVTAADIRLFQNAFSDKLSPLGFNMFDMLVVDLLHEVELGVWKAVFIHLLRLLDCVDGKLKHELDRR